MAKRTLQELAREALAVQNAVNLSGVAQTFARVMLDLCEHFPDTNVRNRHAIAVMWVDKMADLAGIIRTSHHYGGAYMVCQALAEGTAEPLER